MRVASPSKPKTRQTSAIATAAILVLLLAALAHLGSGGNKSSNPDPTPSACPANQPGADNPIQKQHKPAHNPATPHNPQEYVLRATWCNSALGVKIEWITDGKHDPPPGEYPHRDGSAWEDVTSHGGKVGLIVSPLYPKENTGYIVCSITPKYNGEDLVPPKTLVENFSNRPNTGASCFIGD